MPKLFCVSVTSTNKSAHKSALKSAFKSTFTSFTSRLTCELPLARNALTVTTTACDPNLGSAADLSYLNTSILGSLAATDLILTVLVLP